ncbi:hypothetical protein DBZ36_03990 [Alginatibacterium sediminis]|uniref:Flagellar hook-associated protein 2 n=1 Tax=Alginatibacterium sediminis TaxID=2164068 RepID=A0A420EGE9_9ALTE|nr:flagellar filament capping protein FliD [Alginatibacterium sediminis]RKF19636.1 hypothetical protein DBZ36_03990 [Alginatibacterium sediminis]
MTGITAAGIGSGLDLEALITVTLDAQRVPQEARLQTKRDSLDVTLSAVGAIKSAMSAFLDQLEKAKTSSTFLPRMALVDGTVATDSSTETTTSSSPYTVSLSDDAANGSYDISVLSLAKGSRSSTQTSYADSNAIVIDSAGELTFTTGSGAGAESFTVETTAGMTLKQLREAVNDATGNSDVSLNLINTGSGTQLVIDSARTGIDEFGNPNNLTITNSGGADASLDALIANIATTDDASNAVITVNGIEAQSDTNNFGDVISGVSLTVNSLTAAETSMQVKSDDDAAIANVKAFVDAYNKVISEIDKYSKPDTVLEGEDTERKELSGDSMFRSMKYTLGGMTTKGYTDPNDPSRITTFYALGIEMDNDGVLSLDSTKLTKAIDGDFSRIGEIFAGEGGVADTFTGFVEAYEKSGGVLASREDTTRSQLRDLDHADLALTERMAEHEKTLRAKYTAFDVTMGSLNSQMSYIMGQLG